MERDRRDGWKHAKLTGHKNEDNITALVRETPELQQRILQCAGKQGVEILDVIDGGLNETKVQSVLGNKTKNKTDLKILLSNKETINVSVKKSLGGQVYLIAASRFIAGYEKIYNQIIPDRVKRAMRLYWGEADDTLDIASEFKNDTPKKVYAYQIKKHRLVASTLSLYDSKMAEELLKWFDDNMFNIIDFCFSRGLAADESEKAEIIWYKNTVGENNIDTMLWLPQIKDGIFAKSSFGKKLGGSTIQLPFGFVQWHQDSMQFHHNYDKLTSLFNN